MAKKKAQKVKKEKRRKREKREKAPRTPGFAYDRAVSALGGFVRLYAVFVIAAIIFAVVYTMFFA